MTIDKKFLKQIGIGVASLTFGAALAIFIYAFPLAMRSYAALLLYLTSFLLMMRFWWRYVELFVQYAPSKSFWNFLFDFMISFFGIISVLYVNHIQTWALFGIAAMISSIIRVSMSWDNKKIRKKLRNTIIGTVAFALIFSFVYYLAPLIESYLIASGILIITLIFIIAASIEKK